MNEVDEHYVKYSTNQSILNEGNGTSCVNDIRLQYFVNEYRPIYIQEYKIIIYLGMPKQFT